MRGTWKNNPPPRGTWAKKVWEPLLYNDKLLGAFVHLCLSYLSPYWLKTFSRALWFIFHADSWTYLNVIKGVRSGGVGPWGGRCGVRSTTGRHKAVGVLQQGSQRVYDQDTNKRQVCLSFSRFVLTHTHQHRWTQTYLMGKLLFIVAAFLFNCIFFTFAASSIEEPSTKERPGDTVKRVQDLFNRKYSK